ncbi:STAS domain-containing protein [Umezawaea sp. NPDC059074]|uniref:STAS domain-containing protein n=1 Tax=Umezawaea sp. NPDC059074 TaxID=3346716 RepID=UPI0036937905
MTDQTLTVTLDPRPTGPAVVAVEGELDHHTAPQLSEVLDAVGERGVVVDLTGLAYCDSTGISVLVIAYQQARAADTPFALAGLNHELSRVFQIMGLDKVLPFHPTVAEAVTGLPR